MQSKQKIGHLVLFIANLIFGLNTIVSRSLMPEIMSPYTLTFFRLSGGMLLFWLASIFVKKEIVPVKDIFMLALASVFSLSLNQLPYFVGLSATSPIDASIVITVLPIITMLLAAFVLKEPITLKKAIGVLVGAAGALLLVFSNKNMHGGKSELWGIVLVFSAVSCFAVYLTVFKKLIMKYSAITVMKWMFLFATISCFPFCRASLMTTDFAGFTSDIWLRLAFVVVLASFFTYLLIPIGQQALRPTTFSMYNYLQPVVASFVAVIIGMDSFGLEKTISAILVFAGVYIVTKSKSREQLEAELAKKAHIPSGE